MLQFTPFALIRRFIEKIDGVEAVAEAFPERCNRTWYLDVLILLFKISMQSCYLKPRVPVVGEPNICAAIRDAQVPLSVVITTATNKPKLPVENG